MDIKQFNGLDSFNRDENGVKMSHSDIYTNVVNAIGLNVCKKYIPATKEEIINAFKTDEYLNNIKLKKWDDQHYSFKDQFNKIGITSISLSDTVCTLKQAARMWARQE